MQFKITAFGETVVYGKGALRKNFHNCLSLKTSLPKILLSLSVRCKEVAAKQIFFPYW